jgi:hypothetical protein
MRTCVSSRHTTRSRSLAHHGDIPRGLTGGALLSVMLLPTIAGALLSAPVPRRRAQAQRYSSGAAADIQY